MHAHNTHMHAHTYTHAQTNSIDSELVKKKKPPPPSKGKKKVASIWQNKLGVQDGEKLEANSESELLWWSLRET